MLDENTHYTLLKILDENPGLSQRDLAKKLGISLGKVNYCLNALVEKGSVKVNNFRKSGNKLAYAYILTPQGLESRAKTTAHFLRRKIHEYELLKAEIEELRLESMKVCGQAANEGSA